MNDDELDKYLDQAKANLVNQNIDLGESDSIDEIKHTLVQGPKLDSALEPFSIDTGKSVQLADKDKYIETEHQSQFRKIEDPIKIVRELKEQRNSNAGKKWFNMPKPELTPQVKRDLQLLSMRAALDPKRHYRKEKLATPKFFQMGTVIEGNTEYFSARLSRKERKQTMAEEILADTQAKTYFKKRYSEIQKDKRSGRGLYYKKVQSRRKI